MNLVARSTSVPMDDRSVPMMSRPLNGRARHGTVLDLGGPLADHDLGGDVAAGALASR